MQTRSLLMLVAGIGIGVIAGYLFFANINSKEDKIQPSKQSAASAQVQTYTCAMHPQIRQNEPGLCPICEMELVPLDAAASDNPLRIEMTNEAVKLANVQTTVVGESTDRKGKELRLSGKIKADERMVSSQVAHVPGRIEKLFVTFTGEQVAKGQPLAVLYSPELIATQQELLEAGKLKSVNPELLQAARNKLRFWKIDSATIDNIETEGVIRETFTVFADASGVVTQRRVAVGDYVRRGEPLFDLTDLSKMWVLFDVYENDLSHIKIGDQLEFSTPSIPDRSFRAAITFVDPFINPKTRVATVRAEVNNAAGILKPEMFVTGFLQKKSDSGKGLTIPKSTVLWTGKRSVVYVKVPEMAIPSFEFREIGVGESLGENYVVLEGLKAGEAIVTNGSFTIDAAAQLNNQNSMMNRLVKISGTKQKHFQDFKSEAPALFKYQLDAVALQYITLKDALVLSDAKSAGSTAEAFIRELTKVDMNLVKGEAHSFWMEQLNALQTHGEKISESMDMELQRKQFEFLSTALIQTLSAFGTNHDSFFVQHCPMASDDDGADWIALETEIRNPYFGDKMLKCGYVKDTIGGE